MNNHQLQDAFEVFNQLSEQLEGSYRTLQARVAVLSEELADARDERTRELVEKERLAKRLRNLLDALPGGVVVLDGSGRVQECNPVARVLLGEPLLDAPWREVIARSFAPRTDDGHDVSLRDGRRVSISTCPLGDEPGQILLIQDVTETRVLQERLERHKRLSAMGEMSARLAHQIRTPLAAALLYVSHLARPRLAEAEVHRLADKILARLRHLDGLVRDMLLFARGGAAGDQDTRVADLLHEVHGAVEPLAAAAGCRIKVAGECEDARVRVNREGVTGALQNLVVNAIQICGAGGQLQLEAQAGVAGSVRLMLHDDGPGVPEEFRERLFEPFFTTRSQGTGLGLAVVQAVARAHNGSAWYAPRPEGGSTFGIDLPASAQLPGAPIEQSPRAARAS